MGSLTYLNDNLASRWKIMTFHLCLPPTNHVCVGPWARGFVVYSVLGCELWMCLIQKCLSWSLDNWLRMVINHYYIYHYYLLLDNRFANSGRVTPLVIAEQPIIQIDQIMQCTNTNNPRLIHVDFTYERMYYTGLNVSSIYNPFRLPKKHIIWYNCFQNSHKVDWE